MAEQAAIHKHADMDGHFRRKDSKFRNFISREPGADFPAEKDRYALYLNLGCPWAHRTNIVRSLKGLEDIVQLIKTGFKLTEEGWIFTGTHGSEEKDPLYGFTKLSQLYYKADPNYEGRFTVPTLWDKKTETIVNNESSEIIRMFFTEFDDLLPEHLRETAHPLGGYYPPQLRGEIDAMNDWVYNTVNNGVYKCGFAGNQDAYESNLFPLYAYLLRSSHYEMIAGFKSLDRLEDHLSKSENGPYLFGKAITEADIRLYTTLIRFDVAYYTIFLCNLKMIRHDYPRLSRWLRYLYWDGGKVTNGHAFHDTVDFYVYKYGYMNSKARIPEDKLVVPRGPSPDIFPLEETDQADGVTSR